ncbi:DUF3732 domain-containing protein [Edaphobacter paludis]|uniref:DUF3732 domain-containing protein n=1 Tax=Edaphobacter paludis TaxID=3035702 RepID=A0AAU7DAB3_9BACT
MNALARWNIETIFFLGVAGDRRDIVFEPNTVNIITGASGTGKSTLIKAIDYCLGSKRCELPAHVRRRCVAVGVKWIRGEQELIVGRVVPSVGQDTSTHMFCTTGRGLRLPSRIEEFEGPATVSAAKRFLESAFGIDDLDGLPNETGESKGRATVRHVTPYLFVSKEVIYSETVLLHGLDDADKARDIVSAIPYFLGAADQATAIGLQQLRALERSLEREEARARAHARAESSAKQRAIALLAEAHRLGLGGPVNVSTSEADLIADLRRRADLGLPDPQLRSDDELSVLTGRRRDVFERLTNLRRESKAAKLAVRDSSGARTAIARQKEKLELAEHLKLNVVSDSCPLCSSPTEKGREAAATLQATLNIVRAESAAIERVRPGFLEHDRVLDANMADLNSELRTVDSQISGFIQANESARTLATAAQAQSHLLGRVSFFLETLDADLGNSGTMDLSSLRDSIDALRDRVGKDERDTKIRIAEAQISGFASTAFGELPTVAPCVGSELFFNSRKPDISVIEESSKAVLKMTDVGSDQNYLAIHIALAFGLQRHFEIAKAPVPGVLVFDQISRPYFPAKSENEERDEAEIIGRNEDDDVVAMRKHIKFLFDETERRPGLQVLLIEHAYFADDPRYVAATRQRWTRRSGNALIPLGWPVRPDAI